ncbi:precorrin-4 C(11)-methyltransferase [Phaeovibrio sulfidiphilus]|uniref:Precorrin-4 C(11)-methyltransferase n=1 Tax=Phaeovibrio sulfidiphilus TaxID=1220600 RepID=A0A8J7CPU9_9PROT|nr:precorrin-4 C(11)-methyltransferase [Phaeovibrio sulfidiphilus]MBE1236105.1 precorrin-4 C(11)-methyltransferase [Phaeovibrio sulfidiphilus]
MTVHFIGAGPGAPDLITVRGLNLIRRAPVLLYAGSLVPEAVIAEAPRDAEITDTTSLTLDEIIDVIRRAHERGLDVARVHSGDVSIYSAMAEQCRRLQALGIPYEICPGVPSFAAAAARLGLELTLPEVSQSVVLTRTAVRSTRMPATEDLETFARSRAVMAIHLSVGNLDAVVAKLVPHYGADCPVAVVFRATWPDELILRGTLETIRTQVQEAGLVRTALILVGQALAPEGFAESHLYDPNRCRCESGPPPARNPT